MKKDDKFQLPKAVISARIYVKDNENAGNEYLKRQDVFANLWVAVLGEHLREFTYMASQASLGFSVGKTLDAVEMTWSGYNDVI